MNDREIAEIRRRLRPEKNNIGHIRGCYVNENKTIISEFDQMLGLISSDESEEILSHLRKILSGSIGRNLIDISFTNTQVLESDEHKLLTELRASGLTNDTALNDLIQKIINSCDIEGSYFIIIANDKYDVLSFDANDENSDSSEVFSYILCAICPVKSTKPSLSYSISESKFKNIIRDSVISAPEVGFMFPAFDSRKANIYNALFYTRDISLSHDGFIDSVFKTTVPKPASEQSVTIAEILTSTVSDACDIELIQAVQSQLIEITKDHKANKEDEPLLLSAKDMGTLLRYGEIKEETIGDFIERFEEDLGAATAIPPANVMDIKKFEVKTPEVTIKVTPEHSELIQTRIIDGTKYILIRADNDIEVNGIKINIKDQPV